MFLALAAICGIVSLICAIIILIDAFKNEIWKGIVGLLCGLYLLYYAIVEFQHEKKWLIIAGFVVGSILANVFAMMGGFNATAAQP